MTKSCFSVTVPKGKTWMIERLEDFLQVKFTDKVLNIFNRSITIGTNSETLRDELQRLTSTIETYV
jgi:predicted RNase H-related nuclease YkuK (DUF458 family)